MPAGGVAGAGKDQFYFNVGTRTRRRGLMLPTGAFASGRQSLNSTMAALRWDYSTYSNEIPVSMRTRSRVIGHRFTAEIGTVASSATARLLSTGGGGSLSYTSTAVAVWTEWENVYRNYFVTSNVTSHVLGYVKSSSTARAVLEYEVQTLPRVK